MIVITRETVVTISCSTSSYYSVKIVLTICENFYTKKLNCLTTLFIIRSNLLEHETHFWSKFKNKLRTIQASA